MAETMKGKTLLKGHALVNEGWGQGPKCALCRCGLLSPKLPNTNQRQAWHRDHKEEIRKGEQHG